MKKRLLAFIAGGLTLLLFSGCVSEEALLKKANLDQDTDYITYLDLLDNDQLDDSGEYIPSIRIDPNMHQNGKICVTFAQNNYLNIAYYTDAALTKAIDPNNCYLDPGESIYAAVAEVKNSNSNLYQFEEYRIYTTTTEGERKLTDVQDREGQLVYTIPVDFSAGGIQIVPVGKYGDRQFSTNVYYISRSGEKTEIGGNNEGWSVNNSNVMKVSAVEPYTLRYKYDRNRWFFVSASPKQFTVNPDSVGYVEFYESDPSDAMTNYSVELHRRIGVTLNTDQESTICVNGSDAETVKKGKNWTRTNLKYGDFITVETTGSCTIIPSEYQHVQKTLEKVNGQKTYTINITEQIQRTEDPDILKTYEVNLNTESPYGNCTVRLDGKEVKDLTNVSIREDQELKVTYMLTDPSVKFKDQQLIEIFTKKRDKTIPLSMALDGNTINLWEYAETEKK